MLNLYIQLNFNMGKKKTIDTNIINGEGFTKDYLSKEKHIIDKYGLVPIVGMNVYRHPVDKEIIQVLNVVSLGEFEKNMKKQNYDKLFHLYMGVKLQSGILITIEKSDAIVKLNVGVKVKPPTETMAVPLSNSITITQMLDGAKSILGDKFFSYNGSNNNCQDFLIAMLKGVGLLNNDLQSFIKQNTKDLFKKLNFTRKLTNTLTDTMNGFKLLLDKPSELNKNFENLISDKDTKYTDIKPTVDGGKLRIKTIEKGLQAMSRGFQKINPIQQMIENKKTRDNIMIPAGNLTNNTLLPATVQFGKPILYGLAGTAGFMAGGPIGALTATAATKELYDNTVKQYEPQSKGNNIVNKLSGAVGNAVNKPLQGNIKGGKIKKYISIHQLVN